MTHPELKSLAKERGFNEYNNVSKSDLLKMHEEYELELKKIEEEKDDENDGGSSESKENDTIDQVEFSINEYKLILKNGNDFMIPIRKDGMINATELCKAGGKKFNDYHRLKQTQEFILELEKSENIRESKLQLWKPVFGGWMSNLGNCKNSLGKDMTLCKEKFRYNICGKTQYANRLVADAFQIENYEKMSDSKYIVMHIDRDESNSRLENLKITTKSETNSLNGKKSRKSLEFQEKILWTQRTFEHIENKVIPELPSHVIYKNGEIWNGTRFLVFSEHGGYFNVCLKDSTYKLHRLICYAFNPIEGVNYFFEYDKLECNHRDGNTRNNNSDNLEWVTRSEQMRHAYDTGLNNKVRNVLQYSRDGLNFMAEFISIAEASRLTGEPEHRIREISQGKINNKAEFKWKFKNEDESAEYSKKYSKTG